MSSNLAYSVRWNIKNPERYLFQIANPEQTIREVAESAMRAVARAGQPRRRARRRARARSSQRVQENMQQLLDDYGSGVQIQGVAINQSVPPAAVNDAFLDVSAAQQQAQSAINQARAYALQQTARAAGRARRSSRRSMPNIAPRPM